MDQLTQAQSKEFPTPFGTFTCKIPSVKQRLEFSQRVQAYGNSSLVSAVDWDLAEAFGLLDVVVTQAPQGWEKDQTGSWKNYDDVYDVDAFLKLAKEVRDWINSFRSGVRKEKDKVGS